MAKIDFKHVNELVRELIVTPPTFGSIAERIETAQKKMIWAIEDDLDAAKRQQVVHRSAATGAFVSEHYAKLHPDTTVRQVVWRKSF